MFSVLSKWDIFRSRTALSFFYFLIFWLGFLLFLGLFSYSVRNQLISQERAEINKHLAHYVSRTFPSGPTFLAFKREGGAIALQGLSFVRMVRGHEQVFFGGTGEGASFDFRSLVNLDPKQSGVWLKGPGAARWTIESRDLGSGLIFQAGVESSASYAFYTKIRWICYWAAAGAFLLSWGVSFFLSQLSYLPIKRVTEAITLVSAEKAGQPLTIQSGDSTEIRELYAQLNLLVQQNRQLISEMQGSLDNVAHDLRTPMTRLRSVAEYALQAEPDLDRYRDALSDCLEESDRVLSMLKIMMSVAEAESGTMQLNKQALDLAEMLKDIISLYEYTADENDIQIVSELNTTISVMGDKTRLSQVWANLLDNALKYSHEAGVVKVRLERAGDEAIVCFQDQGIGISTSEMSRIWERLYRGDRSRSRPGLGLGLSFVKAVVEAHGGAVNVTSELHKGSSFKVRLPVNKGAKG